jgi:hypothetical protein
MNRYVKSIEVQYLRDGTAEGSMFGGKAGPDLELTTPACIIRADAQQAFELWTELQRLFGWATGDPA